MLEASPDRRWLDERVLFLSPPTPQLQNAGWSLTNAGKGAHACSRMHCAMFAFVCLFHVSRQACRAYRICYYHI